MACSMITTPEIICDLFSFLNKDQIERIQLVNKSWNNVIIRHKNILPLRQFDCLKFEHDEIRLDLTNYGYRKISMMKSYVIKFNGTNLSKIEPRKQTQYSKMTVDEVLKSLNDVVFSFIGIENWRSEHRLDDSLNLIKIVTTKIGGRFRGKFGFFKDGKFGSKLDEIFDNYIIVDEWTLGIWRPRIRDSYIREVCANPEIVQLPSTPKEIRLSYLIFKGNEEVLNFTCNGKLNGANRLTIEFYTSETNYENFIRQWFELYRTHQNPISLVGKFESRPDNKYGKNRYNKCVKYVDIAFDAVKTFLNNTQLRVKYSLETKKLYSYSYGFINHYVKRSCVLHETDSYALVIEMAYREVTNISRINASDLNQPPCDQLEIISLCVKSL